MTPTTPADPGYWQRRWADGQTSWHRADVNTELAAHWPRLGLPAGSAVFVPLCGASNDLAWLAAQGHAVVGADASEIAVQRFFSEHGLAPTPHTEGEATRFEAGGIAIWVGDLFALPPRVWAGCAAVYDRAALVALPAAVRPRYLRAVYGPMAAGTQGLLLTLDYPQEQMDGPAYSVPVAEVRAALEPAWRITEWAARDVLPEATKYREAGVTRLTEHSLHLVKQP